MLDVPAEDSGAMVKFVDQVYFLTFPATASGQLAHGWVEVSAENEQEASRKALREFGHDWSRMYSERQFNQDKRAWYPKGCVRTI